MMEPKSTPGHATRIAGLIPVLATPFTDQGEIAPDQLASLVERCDEVGVDGVMFGGFASEFHKLAPEERSELEAAMLSVTSQSPKLIGVVSIPDHATTLAVRHAERAIAAGADVLNVLPPFFLSPARDQVRSHLSSILDAAGSVPVMLQHAPSQTGGGLQIDDIATLARKHPNLRAIKVESSPPGRTVEAIRSGGTEVSTLIGYAGLFLPDALRRGADGLQPGSSFPELYRALLDHWIAGEEGSFTSLHNSMVPYLSYWMTDVELIVQAEKRISFRRGWFASSHCRLPGRPLDREEERMIDHFLEVFAPWWDQ